MTHYNTLNVKSSNLQLSKLKSAIKNGTGVTLNLPSSLIGHSNDETNFPHKLLTNTQVSKICKAFANVSSANIKFSKTQLSKILQSREFLVDMTGITTGSDNCIEFPFKLLNSYENELSDIDNKN